MCHQGRYLGTKSESLEYKWKTCSSEPYVPLVYCWGVFKERPSRWTLSADYLLSGYMGYKVVTQFPGGDSSSLRDDDLMLSHMKSD